jgi:hypothetical protein
MENVFFKIKVVQKRQILESQLTLLHCSACYSQATILIENQH